MSVETRDASHSGPPLPASQLKQTASFQSCDIKSVLCVRQCGGRWVGGSGGQVLRQVKIRWSARPDCISMGRLWIRRKLLQPLWD